MSALKKVSLMVLAMIMLASLLAGSARPAAAATESATTCIQWHTVQRGEYLVMIARIYDSTWRELAEINALKNPNLIYAGQRLCVEMTTGGGSTPPTSPPVSGSDKVYADSVKEDKYVILRGRSLAASARYSVYLSKDGDSKLAPIFAGYANTDANGAFKATFDIPARLVDVARIGVTLRSGSESIYNWFINATSDDYTGGYGAPQFTFAVVDVEEDAEVTIKTSNLPPNVTFDVLIGKSGSKGEKGILVGTVRDGDGVIRASFDIPVELRDRSKLDIRVENKPLGIYYYVTFENK